MRESETFNYTEGNWVKWIHEYRLLPLPEFAGGVKDFFKPLFEHCPTCIKLDQNYFLETKLPRHYETKSQTRDNRPGGLLHKNCHCQLEDIPTPVPGVTAIGECDIRKFSGYIFVDDILRNGGKKALFEAWGYGIMDSEKLQQEVY